MEQGHRHPQLDRGPGARAPGRSAPPDPGAPIGAGRWEAISLPARGARVPRPEPPVPIVVSVAHGESVRSWALDPGLVLIAGVALALLGVAALDRLLVELLMWWL